MSGTESLDTLGLALAALKADATLQTYLGQRWFVDQAQDVSLPPATPYGIGQQQAAVDIETIPAIRVGTNLLLTFKVVGTDDLLTSTIRPAARRMDAILQGLASSNADVLIFGKLHREEAVFFTEDINGQIVRHLGGTYRCQVQ